MEYDFTRIARLMTQIEQPIRKLPPNDTYRILTLENPENTEKLREACKLAGHQVVPAHTIAEAMAFLDTKDHVDLIVAAAHLENESVFEFLKRVRSADSHLRDVRFLVLCAEPGTLGLLTSPAVEIAAGVMGADQYLLMTEFDASRLMLEIEKLLPPIPSKELTSA
jgi:PleD family two-component response regulator